MLDLKACTVCLSTNLKLYSFNCDQLREAYNLLSGIKRHVGDGLPQYLCLECTAYVRRFRKFRDKCHRTNYTLREILRRNKEITKSSIESINRETINIMPSLSYMNLEKTLYQETKFKWVKYNRVGPTSGPCDQMSVILHDTTNTDNADTGQRDDPTYEMPESNNKVEIKIETGEVSKIENDLNCIENEDNVFENENGYNTDSELPLDNECNIEEAADGSVLEEEYAVMLPLKMNEAKAALEIITMSKKGNHKCKTCNKAFTTESSLSIHVRRHDKHVSGLFYCELCQYYYKTDFLLQKHVTEKHMYKYVCKKCCEVNFDRTSAKQHYIWSHLQESKKDANWFETRPKWLSTRGGKRARGVKCEKNVKQMKHEMCVKAGRKAKKLPNDFLVYSSQTQEEQYSIINDRRNSKNYTDSEFRCELCYRGFTEVNTYNKHMKKHDPEYSGQFQCDMCKTYFKSPRKVYRHINGMHLYKYTCQMCPYVCYGRGQAHMHYKWHKNVTYKCPHCDLEFKKASTHLTHIRIKHPSTYICNLCGHSFVSEAGLYCHKKLAHRNEIVTKEEKATPDTNDPLYCADCDIQFLTSEAYSTHLGSSNKHATINVSTKPVSRAKQRKCEGSGGRSRGRPRQNCSSHIVNTGVTTASNCELCGIHLTNDVQARKHYIAEHPGHEFLKRYMCDVCGHTTKQYANLLVHMRTHTREKPYKCPHCDRRFSMTSNRDRHLVVHTGEKKYQCQHCNRRFTQSSAVKLHIQTVHLKIPYAPWDKANRKRRAKQDAQKVESAPELQPVAFAPPLQHKLLLDAQGDYLNAYITYSDE